MKEKKSLRGKLVTETQLVHAECQGLCVNCIHQKYCTLKTETPKIFCEEYET